MDFESDDEWNGEENDALEEELQDELEERLRLNDELEDELQDELEERRRLNDELEDELQDEMEERRRLDDEFEEELQDEVERLRLNDEFEQRLDDEWENSFNAARPTPDPISRTSIAPAFLHNPPSVPPLMAHQVPESPDLLGPDATACERLIRGFHSPQQVVSLIEAIFTSTDEVAMIRDLRGDDAQGFVDVVNEVRSASSLFRGIA